jgi:hypothetical protein
VVRTARARAGPYARAPYLASVSHVALPLAGRVRGAVAHTRPRARTRARCVRASVRLRPRSLCSASWRQPSRTLRVSSHVHARAATSRRKTSS